MAQHPVGKGMKEDIVCAQAEVEKVTLEKEVEKVTLAKQENSSINKLESKDILKEDGKNRILAVEMAKEILEVEISGDYSKTISISKDSKYQEVQYCVILGLGIMDNKCSPHREGPWTAHPSGGM